MNHQPFETWLLSEDPSDEGQVQSLLEHVDHCDQCASLEASWKDVQRLFETTPRVMPRAGFAVRWQERLAEQKRKRNMYQSWAIFWGTVGSAVVLLALLYIQAVPVLRSPENLVLYLIYRLLSLIAYIHSAQNLFVSLLGTINDLVPAPVWIGLFGTFSMVCVLWFVVLKKLSMSRRINL
jgi:hypothetical protein